VVLLLMASLSNVVGYQSVKSTVNDSPLFNVRTQRATNQQQNTLLSQYLGKGKMANIYFSNRNNTTELLKRVMELISKMDDSSYEQLMNLCLQKIKKDDAQRNHKANKITRLFRQLKTKPEITDQVIPKNNNLLYTMPLPAPSICYWEPGCILWVLLLELYFLIICRRTAAVACQTLFEPCNVS
jgi:hypothetical protein